MVLTSAEGFSCDQVENVTWACLNIERKFDEVWSNILLRVLFPFLFGAGRSGIQKGSFFSYCLNGQEFFDEFKPFLNYKIRVEYQNIIIFEASLFLSRAKWWGIQIGSLFCYCLNGQEFFDELILSLNYKLPVKSNAFWSNTL